MDKYWTEFSFVHATLSRSTNDEKRHHGLHLDQLMKSYKKISYLTIFLAERETASRWTLPSEKRSVWKCERSFRTDVITSIKKSIVPFSGAKRRHWKINERVDADFLLIKNELNK